MKKFLLLSILLAVGLSGCVSGSNSRSSLSFVTVERVSFGDTVVSANGKNRSTAFHIVKALNQ